MAYRGLLGFLRFTWKLELLQFAPTWKLEEIEEFQFWKTSKEGVRDFYRRPYILIRCFPRNLNMGDRQTDGQTDRHINK